MAWCKACVAVTVQATRFCELSMAALMHMCTPRASRSGMFVPATRYWMLWVVRWRHWEDSLLITAILSILRTAMDCLQLSANTPSSLTFSAPCSRTRSLSCQNCCRNVGRIVGNLGSVLHNLQLVFYSRFYNLGYLQSTEICVVEIR